MLKNIKKLVVAGMIGVVVLSMTGCGNYQMFDTTYEFDTAIVKLQDGTIIEGQVQSWRDYEDGDQIQVKIDGKTYLVHSENVTLISKGE